MKDLTFEQHLRMQCVEMSRTEAGKYDFTTAQQIYDFVVGGPNPARDEMVDLPLNERLEAAGSLVIDEVGLSAGARNALVAAGITTLRDLAGWERSRIMGLRSLGKKRFCEIEVMLKGFGLTWGMWESPTYNEYIENKKKN